MNKEKKQIREVLKCLVGKRMTSLYTIDVFLKSCLPMYKFSYTNVKVKNLLDEEDYRFDVSISDNYVGSIWYIKTRQKHLYITETMLD